MKIIKFSGENCPACKNMDNWLKSNGFEDKIERQYSIDTELGADFAAEFGIMSIPALVKLNNSNKVKDTLIGFAPKLIKKFVTTD